MDTEDKSYARKKAKSDKAIKELGVKLKKAQGERDTKAKIFESA